MTYLFILLCFLYFNDINIVEKSRFIRKIVADWASFKSWKKSWPDIACPVKATLMRK